MALTSRQRRLILAGALAATLAAVAWVADQEEEAPVAVPVGAKASREAGRAVAANNRAQLELSKLRREPVEDVQGEVLDPFAAKSWYVAPPPPKPAPPPPPAPPPLPFKYLGKLVDGDTVTVFLASQERNYSAAQGDLIDGKYRIDSVDAQRVVLTYLPLDMQQTLMIGGGN